MFVDGVRGLLLVSSLVCNVYNVYTIYAIVLNNKC